MSLRRRWRRLFRFLLPRLYSLGSKLKTQFSNNIRNNFGFLNRTETDTRTGWDVLFKQEGRKVFKEVVPMVAQMIGEHLSEHDLGKEHRVDED